ncbi:hypothetical protein FRC09_006123 [Ceratobasidium sp. 395]|nr:hypothetical protein FRC09_006123 [Ceratobasidium sp. 395]
MSSSNSTHSSSPANSSHEDHSEPATPPTELSPSPAPDVTVSTAPLTLADLLARLRLSPSGWIGNQTSLTQDAEWVEDAGRGAMFLRPRPNVPPGMFSVDASGNIKVSWVGLVTAKDSAVTPHGQFQSYFKEPQRHKRIIRMIRPPAALHPEIDSVWSDQLGSARTIVEQARRLDDGSKAATGYCFLESDLGSLKPRSAIFEKDGSPWEGDTPEGYQYSTWDIPTDIRVIFDDVKSRGYTPRVLEVYDACNSLIHPNDVAAKLLGSIVYITCTLEKILFRGQKVGGRQWQIYANLVKVQLVATNPMLQSPIALSSKSAMKRKASVLDDDDLQLGGPSKKIA